MWRKFERGSLDLVVKVNRIFFIDESKGSSIHCSDYILHQFQPIKVQSRVIAWKVYP